MADHMLLTVLGINPQETEFRLGSESYWSALAPEALYHLLDKGGRRVTKIRAFCTKEALEDTYPRLEKVLAERCDLASLSLPEGGDPEENVSSFLNLFARTAPRSGQLIVDVTHGFRHYSMLMLLGALNVSALREDLTLRNVYYAFFQRGEPCSPIMDLGHLLELSKWIYTTNTMQDSGSLMPMAHLIDTENPDQLTKGMVKELKELSQALTNALPLELGIRTKPFLQERMRQLKKKLDGPQQSLSPQMSKELADKVKSAFSLYNLHTPELHPRKSAIMLDSGELDREAKLIVRLYAYGHQTAAFGLMREWMVNWVLYQTQTRENWLNKKVRHRAESSLYLLSQLIDDNESARLSAPQKELAKFWKQLREIRNAFAHHGMSLENIFGDNMETKKREAWKTWQEQFARSPLPKISMEVEANQYERLIVSPLGNTPGVLYSAVRSCSSSSTANDLCLVISSKATSRHLPEALEQAGFKGRMAELRLQDPFSGLEERTRLKEQALQFILGSREVHVNMTGGTTLMGLLVDEIANDARKYQRLASRFVLIDKRTPDEQRDNPYVAGEKIVVETAAEAPSE